jgi:diguanylate cyclase (GGDEF)-like protein
VTWRFARAVRRALGMEGLVLDFTDDVMMAALRGRVLAYFYLFGGLTSAGVLYADRARPGAGGQPWLVLSLFFVVGFLCLWRGGGWGERRFLVVSVGGLLLGALFLLQIARPGSLDAAELTLLNGALLPAVFCRERRHVVITTLASVVVILWVGWVRIGPTDDLMRALSADAVIVLTVTFVVRLLRDMARAAVERANLGEMTDPMTGLSNRRGLERFGARSWLSLAERQSMVAVLVVDIDYFKRVNDSRGHAAGDELIRRVGGLLRSASRPADVVVRLGGEEFLLLLPVEPGQGRAIAERIRMLAEQELRPVTVSVGVHEVAPHPGDALPQTLWQAVDTADQALYAAKNAGRNRVAGPPRVGAPSSA